MSDEMITSQTKLFVGGLNWKMRGNDLREEFAKFGEIVFARVNLDRDSNPPKSRGFGFVEFANADDAAKAQAEMDGQEVRGRAIKVDFAKEDPNRTYHNREESAPAPRAAEDETEVDENAF
jgi:nucleolin